VSCFDNEKPRLSARCVVPGLVVSTLRARLRNGQHAEIRRRYQFKKLLTEKILADIQF